MATISVKTSISHKTCDMSLAVYQLVDTFEEGASHGRGGRSMQKVGGTEMWPDHNKLLYM